MSNNTKIHKFSRLLTLASLILAASLSQACATERGLQKKKHDYNCWVYNHWPIYQKTHSLEMSNTNFELLVEGDESPWFNERLSAKAHQNLDHLFPSKALHHDTGSRFTGTYSRGSSPYVSLYIKANGQEVCRYDFSKDDAGLMKFGFSKEIKIPFNYMGIDHEATVQIKIHEIPNLLYTEAWPYSDGIGHSYEINLTKITRK